MSLCRWWCERGFSVILQKIREVIKEHSQFVALQSGVMQQLEAAVVLLREIDVGHHGQNLNDAPEVFGNGVV